MHISSLNKTRTVIFFAALFLALMSGPRQQAQDLPADSRGLDTPQKTPFDDFAERRAIEWVRATGGDVSYQAVTPEGLGPTLPLQGEKNPPLPKQPVVVSGIAYSTHRRDQANDKTIAKLKGLREITDFSVYENSDITNDGVAMLAELSTLSHISLRNHHRITDDGFKHLAKLKQLSSLEIPATGLTDNGLASLKQLPIESLALSQCNLTNAACEHLAEMNKLRSLNLSYVRTIDDKGIARLRTSLIDNLVLNYTGVTGDVVDHLVKFKNLNHVALIGTPLNDACLQRLAVSDLRFLYIANTKITDQAMQTLAGMKTLEVINIGDNEITDQGLKHLHASKSLRVIYMKGTKASSAGIKALRTALPNCSIGG